MANAARLLIFVMVALVFANAQCVTMCSIQPCHSEPAGHCSHHPQKTAAPACLHGQFARTVEVQPAPAPAITAVAFTAAAVPIQVATEPVVIPTALLVQPEPPTLQSLRI